MERRHYVLSTIMLGTMSNAAGRFVLPAVLPNIIETFAITSTAAGCVITISLVGFGVSQYPGGRLSDQLSPKTVLVAGAALFTVGFSMLAGSRVFPTLVTGALLVGIANGFYLPASLSELSNLFPQQSGRAFGINGAAIQFGSAVGPGLVVLALLVGEWRHAFSPVAVALLLTVVLLHHWTPGEYVLSTGVAFDLRPTLRRILSPAPARGTMLSFVGIGFVWQGGINFLPVYMRTARGFSPTFASIVFAGIFVTSAVAAPIAGSLGDQFDCVSVALSSILVGLGGLALLLLASSPGGIAAGVLVFGVGIASFWPLMDAFVIDQLPDETKAGDFGALNTLSLVGGAFGPVYMGAVTDRGRIELAYAGLVVGIIAVAALLLWLRRYRTP